MSEKTQPENNAPEEIKDEKLADVDGGFEQPGGVRKHCPKCYKAFIGFECPACGTSVRY